MFLNSFWSWGQSGEVGERGEVEGWLNPVGVRATRFAVEKAGKRRKVGGAV